MKKATKKTTAKKASAKTAPAKKSPAKKVAGPKDTKADWRIDTLARMRALIKDADPEVTEEVKWRKPSNGMRGVPVWEHAGIICTGETYKAAVKLTFANGAALPDPAGLFNASLEGNQRRAIDIHEGATINEKAFKALIRAAVTHNVAKKLKRG
ncbi:MAG: hypothetical protein A4S14_16390 [Proteobacteria bacterium SG_bin9]|nr:MAG: hypothetical protein A4S14_16390 [Proteobacteria bacterium SG_bin9]